jgi:YD repeat-containing protein
VTTNPDGSSTVNVYQDGRITSSTHSVLGATTYTYDAFNRLASVAHTENGFAKTTSYTYNTAGQTLTITENPGNRETQRGLTPNLVINYNFCA